MSLPNSPMMLDSTGQTIVQKLQGIIDALGGGGGTLAMPPEYDPELEDNTKGYYVGQYVTYQDSLYKCNSTIYVTIGTPAGAFDDTKWDEITDLFNEFFQFKPGRTTNISDFNEVFNYSGNTVSGQYAHAEGYMTNAGNCAHAEGQATQATGSGCHAEGASTNAGGQSQNAYAHAEGYGCQATAYCSHAEGSTSYAVGNYCHAEGYNTTSGSARGDSCHSEGYYTEATGTTSHAEGYRSKAKGSYSHAEGYQTQANESYTHAEGYQCVADGYCSKASGRYCNAIGSDSVASGYYSNATAQNSKADGYFCKATSMYEHAVGKFNKSYTDGNDILWYQTYNTYAVGDKCRLYDDPNGNKIYRCITAVETPEEFDSSKWTEDGEYYNSDDTLVFEVGTGDGNDEQYRKNSFEVFKDGRVKINGKTAIAIDPPSTDGTYTLKCTVSSGVVSYSWVADV